VLCFGGLARGEVGDATQPLSFLGSDWPVRTSANKMWTTPFVEKYAADYSTSWMVSFWTVASIYEHLVHQIGRYGCCLAGCVPALCHDSLLRISKKLEFVVQ
jgi:hypothetical protein